MVKLDSAQKRAEARDLPGKARRDAGNTALPKDGRDEAACPKCGMGFAHAQWEQALFVCPQCGFHMPIGCYYRLSLLLDEGSFEELSAGLIGEDALAFPGYADKLRALQENTGLTEAVVTAKGAIGGVDAVICVLDGRFLMGSMGTAVGEKVTLAAEVAREERLPLIIFSASGGVRMQEGIFALMQMAKTSAAIADFLAAGGLYISVFTHPTTGGVTASFASLGDVTLAEPGAMVGFAGPRVIEQTIGCKLPEGFQSSEYLQEHGFVDRIVPRGEMRKTLSQLLRLHRTEVTAP